MQLVDIGANLTHDTFDHDRQDVIGRAMDAGVAQFVVTGATAEGSRQARDLARRHPGVMAATAGVHPHHAREYDDDVHTLMSELAGDEAVVALGECGLDFFRDFSPRDTQEAVFERQLEQAASLSMPVFLHQRDAHERFIAILGEFRDRLPAAVVHCFTGGREELHHYLDLDCHVGITGWICDERRGHHLREFVHEIPPDRLMIETDAPYLLPRDLKPKPKTRRNEPMYLRHICETVAAARGESAEETAAATTATARKFFGLP
jgi:TatD DNase family protein